MRLVQLNGGQGGRLGLRHDLSWMVSTKLAKQDEAISDSGMGQSVVRIFSDCLPEVFNSCFKLFIGPSAPGVSPPKIKLIGLAVLRKALPQLFFLLPAQPEA